MAGKNSPSLQSNEPSGFIFIPHINEAYSHLKVVAWLLSLHIGSRTSASPLTTPPHLLPLYIIMCFLQSIYSYPKLSMFMFASLCPQL
jgi:hypothetical protein